MYIEILSKYYARLYTMYHTMYILSRFYFQMTGDHGDHDPTMIPPPSFPYHNNPTNFKTYTFSRTWPLAKIISFRDTYLGNTFFHGFFQRHISILLHKQKMHKNFTHENFALKWSTNYRGPHPPQ